MLFFVDFILSENDRRYKVTVLLLRRREEETKTIGDVSKDDLDYIA